MKRSVITAIAVVLAMPASAQDRMTRTMCQDAVKAFSSFVDRTDPDFEQALRAVRITSDGWCQFRATDLEGQDVPFAELDFAAEDTARWIDQGIPPMAVHLRARGLNPDAMDGSNPTNRPDVSLDLTVRQIPDAGQIVLERAVLNNGAGDVLSISAVLERVFLTSSSMMQVSMGSATFKAGLMSMSLSGDHENPFGFKANVDVHGTPSAQRDAAFQSISRLPDGVMDDASRAELTAYAVGLPKPVGTLEVSVGSERGIGLMQVGMSFYNALDTIATEGAAGDEMGILFDGLSVTANWSPDAQAAD